MTSTFIMIYYKPSQCAHARQGAVHKEHDIIRNHGNSIQHLLITSSPLPHFFSFSFSSPFRPSSAPPPWSLAFFFFSSTGGCFPSRPMRPMLRDLGRSHDRHMTLAATQFSAHDKRHCHVIITCQWDNLYHCCFVVVCKKTGNPPISQLDQWSRLPHLRRFILHKWQGVHSMSGVMQFHWSTSHNLSNAAVVQAAIQLDLVG